MFLSDNKIVSIMFLFGLKFFITSKIVQVSKKKIDIIYNNIV